MSATDYAYAFNYLHIAALVPIKSATPSFLTAIDHPATPQSGVAGVF
ncbi:hypothetical protein [Nostoc sp. CALU 546]